MDSPTERKTLCGRCKLLSFDDLAIGGREDVDSNGSARLSLSSARIEYRPKGYKKDFVNGPDYILIRLDWYLLDILPDMPRLLHSSQLGCTFCSALWSLMSDSLARYERRSKIQEVSLTLALYLSISRRSTKVIDGILAEGTYINSRDEAKVHPILFPIEAAPRVDPARESHYLTAQNVSEMCRLLETCTNRCHVWKDPSYTPSRLVDVGNDPESVPRLVLSTDVPVSGGVKYAALSYCWGNEAGAQAQFKTETASFEQRREGIPYKEITPAIGDAISLTRAIGLRYLWVDALCIIQDDTNDWSHESGHMNLIYRHAFVTFCGLNSNSCNETLLQRAPVIKIPFQSTIRPGIRGYYLIRLRSRNHILMDDEKSSWDRSISNWSQRGWVFQEEQLSARLLLFGSLRMHFSCGSIRWSEGYTGTSIWLDPPIKFLDQIAQIKRGEIEARSLYKTWVQILDDYGKRLVTQEKDRLPAISGIARIIWEILDDQYLAGVWRGDIFRGLNWTSHGNLAVRGLRNHIENQQKRHYTAPSWSWASCRSGLDMGSMNNDLVKPLADLVNANVEVESQNLFGQISGGFLLFRGKLAPIPAYLSRGSLNAAEHKWLFKFDRECSTPDVVANLDWLQEKEETGLESLMMFLILEDNIKVDRFPISQQKEARLSSPSEKSKHLELTALILHTTRSKEQYYRVGNVRSFTRAGYDLMQEWFEGIPEQMIRII